MQPRLLEHQGGIFGKALYIQKNPPPFKMNMNGDESMANRTLYATLEYPWQFCSIDVKDGQRTYQVHRIGGGINFKANRRAMKELTPKTYMLYMSMVMDAGEQEWLLDEDEVASTTSLKTDDVENAVQELLDKKYLIPGEISIGGVTHKRNTYHLWEAGSAQRKS